MDIWNSIVDVINSILNTIFSFLPRSPFSGLIDDFTDSTLIANLNWFIPIGDFITILSAWLGAIVVYYAYQIILRWIKAVGD